MQRLVRSFASVFTLITLLAAPAFAAERSTTLLENTDLPGFDYSVIKDGDVKSCQASCEEDRICRAFTYNDKAGWCFLKGDVGPETEFKGATSGRISMAPDAAAIRLERKAELPFPAYSLTDDAEYFAAQLPRTDSPPTGATYADLVKSGDDSVASENMAGAMAAYRQALAVVPNDPMLWVKLSQAAIVRSESEAALGNSTYDIVAVALNAAFNGFLRSDSTAEQAATLGVLAQALERTERWPEAIATYRASIALVDNAGLTERLDAAVEQHGFRITSNTVDAEAETPRICVLFSESLPADNDIASYVVVENAPTVAVDPEESQICLTGVDYGQRYKIKIRAGLPAQSGETLNKDVELSVYVPARSPFVGFANNAYVMPAGLGGGLPITSVNAESADVVIYRIGDRSIATAVRNGVFQGTLDEYKAQDIADQSGEEIWRGAVDLAKADENALTTTAIPVSDVLTSMAPGAYVITAKVTGSNQEYWEEVATQWFIITDLGLTTVSGDDGVHAFVRALGSAQPVANAKVRLVAVNNEILGETTTNANGRADFAPGLARGTGGRAPQLLVAETDSGDYAFLDMTKSAFDLTDRGVEGRPYPGPLDLFATTERGVYRPGETVFLTALLRDAQAQAVKDLPLTIELERPDGVIASREVLKDRGAGSYFAALDMVEDAMRGSWRIRLLADPKDSPLTYVNFLVEDFEPERLAFELTAPEGAIDPAQPFDIDIMAKYLYGATAPGLNLEADVITRPLSSLAGYPGYSFGRLDDSFQTSRAPIGIVGMTDGSGAGVASITLPELVATTRPLEAQVLLRLVDTNGRTVERSVTRPVVSSGTRIGLRPKFDENAGLAEGSAAAFDVVAVAPDGALTEEAGLTWSLGRIETRYQWYRSGDRWQWEGVTTEREVANGTLDLSSAGPGTISANVDAGQYRLSVQTTGEDPTSTTYEFYAGYYYPVAGSDTPDTLKVALDKPSYKVGDKAVLRLDPQFAGEALIMVVDNRIIDMQAVTVPAEGTTVSLDVTENWGPGAYVTAMLYRPADSAEKRMPARAIGLAYGDVEPGDRVLDVAIDAPAETLPRAPLTIKVKLGNVAAGQKAHVALAAVDLGILNLTNFKTPDPDGWFFGQRQLGIFFRDLYGQMIDPTQGMAGALRSGGDGSGSRSGNPPPISVLLALHSDIVEVDADGVATISFDLPDFAGTARLMAMAWTESAVGHAQQDVIIRDPVVITLSPPRFLRIDDTARLLVEVNNVSGPAGDYKVAVASNEEMGIEVDAPETVVTLAEGARIGLDLQLSGKRLGDHPIMVTITGPTGVTQVKELLLGVRAASAPVTTTTLYPLPAGESLTLDAASFDGITAHTGTLSLSVGPLARLNVPELLLALDRYPYGCAEQVSSRALPLLYINEVAERLGLGNDDALDQKVRDAIANLLSKQTSSGSFGLWGPSSYTDLWLDSFVTDFLLRAKAEGYDVPELAMTMALDNLANQLAYATDFEMGGEDIAYVLHDLARGGRATMGDLRYYFEARLDNFGSPLAKAQIGAALALYGDRARAEIAFAAAVEALNKPEDRRRYRSDYGSKLRDTAAILALAAEFKPASVDLAALAQDLAVLRDQAKYTSTQEDTWTLLAAAALGRDAGSGSVTINTGAAEEALTGSVYQLHEQDFFDSGQKLLIINTANQDTEALVSVTGIPEVPPPASSTGGFTISRTYYNLVGDVMDISEVTQNERFVVSITVDSSELGSGQVVLSDPLPAGFEIENPDLSASAEGVSALAWLRPDAPLHFEARTDQYVAAFRFTDEAKKATIAYIARAVTPGTFVLPGTTVEDMYRPERRANLDGGSITILPAGQGDAEKRTDDLISPNDPRRAPDATDKSGDKQSTSN